MNSSFLLHFSSTIPRTRVASQIFSHASKAATKPSHGKRSLTTKSPITVWGADALTNTLRLSPSKPVLVALQRVRNISNTSVYLRERDPNDNNDEVQGGAKSQGDDEGGDDNSNSSKSSVFNVIDSQLQKPSVPDVYPQVLALPIARRPLFPGFYKAVVVKDPDVTSAIKELLKRGQPYVGAFLLKDEKLDTDIITDLDQVYPVGVFAQITSVFPTSSSGGDKDREGLTAVLYPHRRIKITDLLSPKRRKEERDLAETEEVPLGEAGRVSSKKSAKVFDYVFTFYPLSWGERARSSQAKRNGVCYLLLTQRPFCLVSKC